nr:hypothetical protein [Cressdnaviricota sp.]
MEPPRLAPRNRQIVHDEEDLEQARRNWEDLFAGGQGQPFIVDLDEDSGYESLGFMEE